MMGREDLILKIQRKGCEDKKKVEDSRKKG